MNIAKFEELAEQVRNAKRRASEAAKAYDDALDEINASREHEQSAYREFMRFVRDSAGIKSDLGI